MDDDNQSSKAQGEVRRGMEKLLRDTMRQAIEKGIEKGVDRFNRTDKAIREVVEEVKLPEIRLPRELVNQVIAQLEDTKNHVARVAARETREFLQNTDLATEMQRVLSSLSLEVRTQVRFVPNKTGERLNLKATHQVGSIKKSSEDDETDANTGSTSAPPEPQS